MNDHPKITVVTPSYNQAQFLEDTIESVLGQGYPNLEYIVMDGGSTDGSVEIIKKYDKHLAYWTSGKDGGQSAAINAGFARSTGDILAWLNSDDTYLPGTLRFVAGQIDVDKPEVLFGNCVHLREDFNECQGSVVEQEAVGGDLHVYNHIIQPSAFWTRRAWEAAGPLQEDLHYSMDWDWFQTALEVGVAFHPVVRYLSLYRKHEAHKSGSGGQKRLLELSRVYERHSGPKRRDLFLECCRVFPAYDRFVGYCHQTHVVRALPFLLPRRFPQLFRGNNHQEVLRLLRMGWQPAPERRRWRSRLNGLLGRS